MPVDFNLNLTFGLKRQVGGIKAVTVQKRSIFQVEWLIVTLIFLSIHTFLLLVLYSNMFFLNPVLIIFLDLLLFNFNGGPFCKPLGDVELFIKNI